ncbi:MAG TPA: DAK2 domain-containing protein, partial [Tenuifilaceae bacterium]|nr:DAK2 domain-containing protein [Tenuifilaceae bacterium]
MDTELKINEVEVKPHELKVSVNVKEINKRIENIHRYLNSHKEYLNRLNVFPVPDGDTGLNLTLTFQGAMASMQGMENESMLPGEYLKNFTEQMLLNSRGCSGVIFSLFAQGVAQVLENNDFSNENLHRAIANGFKNAWDGTENPREGTMLTLMREFRDIFGKYIQEEKNAAMVISKSIPYLMEVLDRTPEMLPVLKQAGVVDSGGAGFIIILQGIDRELKHNGSGF